MPPLKACENIKKIYDFKNVLKKHRLTTYYLLMVSKLSRKKSKARYRPTVLLATPPTYYIHAVNLESNRKKCRNKVQERYFDRSRSKEPEVIFKDEMKKEEKAR
jgi:hypothetical protein